MSESATRSTIPVYQHIKAHLAQRIGTQWKAGTRLPPIAELAKELGAGQRNTHRAVQAMVDEGMLVSRPGAGTFVASQLDQVNLGNAIRKTGTQSGTAHASAGLNRLAGRTVRLLHAERQQESMILDMMDAAAEVLHAEGAGVARGRYRVDDPGHLSQQDADALMLFNPGPRDIAVGPEHLLVVVNTALESGIAMPGRFDVISVEQEQGGFLAGAHLRELGYDRACFVGAWRSREITGMYDQTSEARLAGFERGLRAKVAEEHRLRLQSYDYFSGTRAVAQWLKLPNRPEAVFAASDDLAMGFILGAEAHELKFGRDYQLVGFDGQYIARKIPGGPLSTVVVPAAEMGRRGARLLIDRFAEPDQPVRKLFLGCEFRAGTTTSPIHHKPLNNPSPLGERSGEGQVDE